MRQQTSRISTTKQSVSCSCLSQCGDQEIADDIVALKEDNAEGALKAFRTIVDEQAEKGEWLALPAFVIKEVVS